jgi:hypothetical protein
MKINCYIIFKRKNSEIRQNTEGSIFIKKMKNEIKKNNKY